MELAAIYLLCHDDWSFHRVWSDAALEHSLQSVCDRSYHFWGLCNDVIAGSFRAQVIESGALDSRGGMEISGRHENSPIHCAGIARSKIKRGSQVSSRRRSVVCIVLLDAVGYHVGSGVARAPERQASVDVDDFSFFCSWHNNYCRDARPGSRRAWKSAICIRHLPCDLCHHRRSTVWRCNITSCLEVCRGTGPSARTGKSLQSTQL
mmetsp:Transcript_24221/g.38736  ORF Transcript_24221/g.38736 Transcript_24221/m.38736 type:complete len:207 (+) Transcript_24221:320-940(+)